MFGIPFPFRVFFITFLFCCITQPSPQPTSASRAAKAEEMVNHLQANHFQRLKVQRIKRRKRVSHLSLTWKRRRYSLQVKHFQKSLLATRADSFKSWLRRTSDPPAASHGAPSTLLRDHCTLDSSSLPRAAPRCKEPTSHSQQRERASPANLPATHAIDASDSPCC